jgi:hypothetical protein
MAYEWQERLSAAKIITISTRREADESAFFTAAPGIVGILGQS